MPADSAAKPCSDRRSYVRLGQVLRPHGLRGEIKVTACTARRENLLRYTKIFLGAGTEKSEHRVLRARMSGGALVLGLNGCDSREEAQRLQGQEIWLDVCDLPPPSAGELYLHTLMGKEARTHEGLVFGRVAAVLDTEAHTLLVVRDGGREVLIPAVGAFIAAVDADAVTFTLPEGLLEINAA